MKVTVIGGGSTYTPELISGFLSHRKRFPVDELWLMDIDHKRLDIVGRFAQRIVENHGAPFKVILTDNQRDAIQGSSYIVTQFRVGMMGARRKDEYLGHRHGLVGQETTGIGGMAKALRTIPVILNIARDVEEIAPDALLINFTNPVGLITEALSRYAENIKTVGVCNVPITTKMKIIEKLEKFLNRDIDPHKAYLDTMGLNHLTWHRGFSIDGEDIWPLVIESYIKELEQQEDPEWDPQLIEALRMIPNYYLNYYYQTEKKLKDQQQWPPSRAEEVIEIEKGLLEAYSDPNLSVPPKDLMNRGGAYYSTMAVQFMASHYNDLGEIHVVNTPNRGAVGGWPEDWVLEMPCNVDLSGIHPKPSKPLPGVCFGLIAQVKSFETLTVEAAVHGDRDAAFQALLAHPLGPAAGKITDMLDDMLETNRKYLPQF